MKQIEEKRHALAAYSEFDAVKALIYFAKEKDIKRFKTVRDGYIITVEKLLLEDDE